MSLPLLTLGPAASLLAQPAAAGGSEESQLWSAVIALLVLAATLASAALPWSAARYWRNRWRYWAWAPLLALGLLLANIGLGKWLQPGSHGLWLFEVFAWAMLNMVYMVSIMTAKRMIEKADAENAGDGPA